MILNPDCLRDVLLSIENMHQYVTDDEGSISNEPLFLEPLCDALPAYHKEEIFYTLTMLDQAGLVSISVHWASDCVESCIVNSLTFSGHELLAKIHDEERWRGIKQALPAIRNYSLDAINAVSQGFTSGAISALLEKGH